MRSKALQRHGSVKVETQADNGAPDIIKYSSWDSKEGYAFVFVDNKAQNQGYSESVTFTKFDGLKLLPPFSGQEYKISVQPNS